MCKKPQCKKPLSDRHLNDLALSPHAQDLPSRPRRNRRSESFRSAIRECIVTPSNFILPIFVHEEGSNNVPIPSMPGIFRLAYGKNVLDYVAEARSYGVNQVVVFPKVRGVASWRLGWQRYPWGGGRGRRLPKGAWGGNFAQGEGGGGRGGGEADIMRQGQGQGCCVSGESGGEPAVGAPTIMLVGACGECSVGRWEGKRCRTG